MLCLGVPRCQDSRPAVENPFVIALGRAKLLLRVFFVSMLFIQTLILTLLMHFNCAQDMTLEFHKPKLRYTLREAINAKSLL